MIVQNYLLVVRNDQYLLKINQLTDDLYKSSTMAPGDSIANLEVLDPNGKSLTLVFRSKSFRTLLLVCTVSDLLGHFRGRN